MSAPPGGGAPGTVNGPKAPALKPTTRRKPNADPLRARQKPRPNSQVMRPPADWKPKSVDHSANLLKTQADQVTMQRRKTGGWSEAAPLDAMEFPLVTTKREIMEGLRYHIMRLSKYKNDKPVNIDVTDQDQFPRPVTLHRRDPRQPSAHRMMMKQELIEENPADDTEAERLRQQKAEREAQRALDQAQIAPVARPNEPKKQQTNKKEKASAFYGRNTEEKKKQTELRYAETLPWHLESADADKGVWVGSYIAGLSDVNCALAIDGGRFRMIPLERYYRFDEKPRFSTLTLEEAENMMKKNHEVKRWVMLDKEKEKEIEDTRRFIRGGPRVKTESATSRAAPRAERQDDRELDMSGDEFQDDDETPGFEADDEDSKDAKERLRRNHLASNTFGEGEEDKVDEEEREEKMEKLKRKTIGKQTAKALVKLEHAMDYDELDSEEEDNNPFTSESESDDEEEEKKEEEKKEDIKKEDDSKKDQTVSGANSKGTNTPSKSKGGDANKKGKLKRAGSPNLSESSEAESTRKKAKTGKGTASMVPSRAGTPLPGQPKAAGGATSDGEATAGEASDGGLKLKKKKKQIIELRGGRSDSRAGSAVPSGAPSNSPNKGVSTPRGSPPPSQPAPPKRIEASEIIAAIPAEGITLGNLLRMFHSRIDKPGGQTKSEWLQMVKQHGEYESASKLLKPKKSATPST